MDPKAPPGPHEACRRAATCDPRDAGGSACLRVCRISSHASAPRVEDVRRSVGTYGEIAFPLRLEPDGARYRRAALGMHGRAIAFTWSRTVMDPSGATSKADGPMATWPRPVIKAECVRTAPHEAVMERLSGPPRVSRRMRYPEGATVVLAGTAHAR